MDAFFEAVFEDELSRHPTQAAYLGLPHDDTQWTSMSYAAAEVRHVAAQGWLDKLHEQFDEVELSESDALSVQLFERRQQATIDGFPWFYHWYRINQMWGAHTWVPSFLMTVHRIEDEATARSWIARVRNVKPLFAELQTVLAEQEARGILPPKFVYPHVADALARLLNGTPFTGGRPSPLLAHFEREVAKLSLDAARSKALLDEARAALQEDFGPAYLALAAQLVAQNPDTRDGVWKLPDGEAFYTERLAAFTTTDMSAEAIHELGLSEVARIQDEMRALMPALSIKGDLPELYDFLRTTEAYTLPNTDEGRAQYLELARRYVTDMEARLPEVFAGLPDSPLEVRRVEPWREQSSGKAFYQRAAPDGSRPGIFYANLRDMTDMPTYQLEALVYHEGVPGHHLQNAISMALDDLPPFRRYDGYAAYGEGWGLYSEYLPKELGMYTDPVSDVGRLAMELWRAARLVVDTGIHHRRWTREQAVEYLVTHTPNPRGDCVRAIERYIVAPGQATAYKIGMIRILELRERAREALGDRFALTDFHRVVLSNGPVPLDVLELQIEDWIAALAGTPAGKE
ncbi:MAG: DUF885 domain-containing protein [Myxococcota bacterium]